MAFDGGSWVTAALLLPVPDPMGRAEFGGDEDELEAIYAYRKALTALRKQKEGAEGLDDEGEDEVPEATKKNWKKTGWWQKKKDEEK